MPSNDYQLMIRHILLLQFAADTSEDQIADMFSQFCDLQTSIDGIQSIDFGVNNNPEGLHKQFTHAAVVTFTTKKARDQYLPHPVHQQFKNILTPLLADLIVLDI